MMKKSTTSRGFNLFEFQDANNETCSIQTSSALELFPKEGALDNDPIPWAYKLWLGVNNPNPRIMVFDAEKLGIDTKGAVSGWVDFPMPKEVITSTRMHLQRHHVEMLVKQMTFWLEQEDFKDLQDEGTG